MHQTKECANKSESTIRKILDQFETQYVLQPIYHLAISDQPFTFMHTYVIERIQEIAVWNFSVHFCINLE